TMAVQEPGVRPARAVPYDLSVECEVDFSDGEVELEFSNKGKAAAVFQVRSGDGQSGPWTYTVGAGKHVSDDFDFSANGAAAYDPSVYGPNGFMRRYAGSAGRGKVDLDVVECGLDDRQAISLDIANSGHAAVNVRIFDAYANETTTLKLRP